MNLERVSWFLEAQNLIYCGRNGIGKCQGLQMSTYKKGPTDAIILTPINSKGFPAHCYIEIPRHKVEALIRNLQLICSDQRQ